MIDFKAWGTVDPIAVEDAAYLWAGIDPSTYSFALTSEQRGAFTARLRMLTVRIQSKTLNANTASNAAAFIGVHDKSLVSRADLIAIAELLGERPEFLYFHEIQSARSGPMVAGSEVSANGVLTKEPTTSSNASTKTEDLQPISERSQAWLTFAHKPGTVRMPDRLQTASSSRPISLMRERIVPVATQVLPPKSRKASISKSAGRRGAAVRIDDDAIVSEMMEHARTAGESFSVRDFALANAERIGGRGTDDAKIRRLQRKYDEAKRLI